MITATWMQPTNIYQTMLPKQYIKGFAINRQKIADFFTIEPNSPLEGSAIHETIRWLERDRDGFMFIACGIKPDQPHRMLVIVLDEDYDEDALRGRPTKPFSPSLTAVFPVVDGPDVWERVA
jgi:hypothetical protein